MNIFSNIGITELILILLLALLVVGPERLPELARKLGQTLRDLRKAYENLTRDIGPELASLQEVTQELRESVDSVRTIPQDMVQTVVQAADLEDTIKDLKGVTDSLDQVGQTVSSAGQMIKDPVGTAVDTAKNALVPTKPEETEAEATSGEETKTAAEATLEEETEAANMAESALTPAESEEAEVDTMPGEKPESAGSTPGEQAYE